MDDFEMTENTTDTEDFNYEETEQTSNGGSGLVGAVIGGAVVAAGAAVIGAVKRNPKVQEFVAARKEAREKKALEKWTKEGIKKGFIPDPEAKTETK